MVAGRRGRYHGSLNGMLRAVILLAGAALLAWGEKPFPIVRIQVEGNSRLAADAIVQASQLKPGQMITVQDVGAACQRLSETGVFSATRYRYRPAQTGGDTGFDVTLIVEEQQDLREARIEIPGIEPAAVWAWLAQNEPLVTPQMPAGDPATSFYMSAIGRYLAAQGRSDPIAAQLNAQQDGSVVAVFRPRELPRIAAVRFEGARTIPAAALEKALRKIAVGSEYTESTFRELLAFNVRRLFEEQGLLAVQFPRIDTSKDADGGLVVTIAVEEGAVYRVGQIEIVGDRLPMEQLRAAVDVKPGDVASWQKLTAMAEKVKLALGSDGYLDGATELERHLDAARAVADVTVIVQKGTQSRFGALRLEGLDAMSALRARAWWKLEPGAVLNTALIDQFEATLMRDKQIKFAHITRRYERPNVAETVNVVFTFTR